MTRCDVCAAETSEPFAPSWGELNSRNEHGERCVADLCPRCTALLRRVVVELRERLEKTGRLTA